LTPACEAIGFLDALDDPQRNGRILYALRLARVNVEPHGRACGRLVFDGLAVLVRSRSVGTYLMGDELAGGRVHRHHEGRGKPLLPGEAKLGKFRLGGRGTVSSSRPHGKGDPRFLKQRVAMMRILQTLPDRLLKNGGVRPASVG